jgi:hypothetical protein
MHNSFSENASLGPMLFLVAAAASVVSGFAVLNGFEAVTA